MPPVLAAGDGELTTGFMPGEHGQDLVDAGQAERVLLR